MPDTRQDRTARRRRWNRSFAVVVLSGVTGAFLLGHGDASASPVLTLEADPGRPADGRHRHRRQRLRRECGQGAQVQRQRLGHHEGGELHDERHVVDGSSAW
jgi:hypothetical protein